MTQEQLNTLFDESNYEEIIAQIEANQETEIDQSFLPSLAISYFHTDNYDKASLHLFQIG